MMDDKFLEGLDDILNNGIKRCAICGIEIDEETDSGWEVFVDGGKFTQSICIWCDQLMNGWTEKVED